MRDSIRVTFQPDGKVVYVMRGSSVVEAAGEAGIILNMPCGGRGTCGNCKVEIPQNAPAPSQADHEHLSPEELSRGFRLACQAHLETDATINVPVEIRFFEKKSLTRLAYRETVLQPNITKRYVELPPPSLEDQRSDMDRLIETLSETHNGVWATLDVIRELPRALRENRFAFTAVLEGREVVAIEPGNTTNSTYGVAFDVGTTTVAGLLVDLTTGEEKAITCRTNPQVVYGDDVVGRISYAQQHPHGLDELQGRIVSCLNDMVAELCHTAGIDPDCVYEVAVVGNTTMNHLLLHIDPTPIAQAPYTAVVRQAVNIKAARLGIQIHPNGNLYALPNIAGFVGSDTVGVVLATDMLNSDRMTLAIDIGTNGEIVMGTRQRLVSCSTAAGPAFEGARIQFGMRAAEGAIEKIVFNNDVEVNVIGNARPKGICGTALLDAVAEMLRVGILDETGRIQEPDNLPSSVPDALRRRIQPGPRGFDFVLIDGSASQTGRPILITQRDIRELQLAKGAISAGIEMLKKELGISNADIDAVLLAGAFGNFIRRSSARRVGLLPDVPIERIRFVGNAAGAGARMALVSRQCRLEAERISRFVQYLELAGRPDFQQQFSSCMLFPQGD